MPRPNGRQPGQPNHGKKVKPGTHPTVAQLTALQQAKGLTDAALSERAGYHQYLPAIWRTGTRRPNLQAMTDFAQVFGYHVGLNPVPGNAYETGYQEGERSQLATLQCAIDWPFEWDTLDELRQKLAPYLERKP